MKSKITPGIWTAYLKKSRFLGGAHWHVATEDHMLLIARVCQNKGETFEQLQANALAMAAVPEMLEALFSIKAHAKFSNENIMHVIATAALDKALGKK